MGSEMCIRDRGKKETIRVPKTINPFPNIEVRFITHNAGCGGTRSDSTMLGKLLAGYVNNPNVAGASVLSLGCQNLQANVFLKELKKMNGDVVHVPICLGAVSLSFNLPGIKEIKLTD